MKNRSEVREVIMKVIYQVNLLDEAKLDYDLSELIKEQIEVKNDFVNTCVDGKTKRRKRHHAKYDRNKRVHKSDPFRFLFIFFIFF